MNRYDYRWTDITVVWLVMAVMMHLDMWRIDQAKFEADPGSYGPAFITLIALYAAAVLSVFKIGRD